MDEKVARLFRNGRSQAVRIPREFELQGESVHIRKLPNGDLLIAAAGESGLLAAFANAPPLDPEDWMDPLLELPAEPVDL